MSVTGLHCGLFCLITQEIFVCNVSCHSAMPSAVSSQVAVRRCKVISSYLSFRNSPYTDLRFWFPFAKQKGKFFLASKILSGVLPWKPFGREAKSGLGIFLWPFSTTLHVKVSYSGTFLVQKSAMRNPYFFLFRTLSHPNMCHKGV